MNSTSEVLVLVGLYESELVGATTGAHMYVTRHSEITDQRLHDELWTLYRRAYAPVARLSPTHEMLDREEFSEQLRSATNRVWVVWDESRPVGMTLITTDVRATRWLNEEFFADNYPDRFRTGRVHYVVWVTIDPSHAARGALMVLARQALAVESRDGALLVFDIPEVHQPHDDGGGAALMLRMAQMVGDAQLVPLTTQRYYAVDFAPEVETSLESEHSEIMGTQKRM